LSGRPARLAALRHRDFRLFWSGQLVSLIGTWMQSVGQAWLVLELTGSPFQLGLVTALQFTPILLLSPVGGALSAHRSSEGITAIVATEAVGWSRTFTVKWKALPCPGRLLTDRWPPISAVRRALIVSPRPVPP